MSLGLPVIDPVSDSPTDQMSDQALNQPTDESPTQPTPAKWSRWSDGIGMLASVGCAVHCALMPFVIAYLPALGLSFLADEAFHKWMAIGCFVIALTAFVPGFRKHRRLTPVIVGSIGLTMISIAAFGFAGECCAACESDATPVVSGQVTSGLDASSADQSFTKNVLGADLLGDDAEVCADGCCPHCTNPAVDSAGELDNLLVTQEASSQLTSSWFSGVVPWLTPLGGIVLVSAHLLNRRYGCSCGCCNAEVAEETSW